MSVVEPDSPARNTRSRVRARSESQENASSRNNPTVASTSASSTSAASSNELVVRVMTNCLHLTNLHTLLAAILPSFIPALAYAAAPVPRIAAGACLMYWTVAETVFRTEKGKNRIENKTQDKGSWFYCVTALAVLGNLSLTLLWIQGSGESMQPLPFSFKQFHTQVTWYGVPLVITFSALALRWLSIATLGDFFSRSLAVFDDHRVVDIGIYSIIRHPGYLANVLLMCGSGLVISGNLLFLLITIVVCFLAWHYRISVEEDMLSKKIAYEQYCTRVRYRLIPGIY